MPSPEPVALMTTLVKVKPATTADAPYLLKALGHMVAEGAITHSLSEAELLAVLLGEPIKLQQGQGGRVLHALPSFFVAYAGPIPVGFVGAYKYPDEEFTELHYAYVTQMFRKKGLGKNICMDVVRSLSNEASATVFMIRSIDKTDATRTGGAKLALSLGMNHVRSEATNGVHCATYLCSVRLDSRLSRHSQAA